MPVATVQATSSGAITLQGSAEIIGDLLGFGVNSILYQRMVYPGDSFTKEKAYGVPVYLCTEQYQVKSFIQQFVAQLKAWLVSKTIQRVVLVLTRLDTEEDIEKWDFNIVCDKTADENTQQTTKPLKEIQNEIRGVIRKIVSSVAILPNLREKCFKTSDPHSFICKDQEDVNLLIRRKETEETTRYISYFYRKSFGQTNIHAKGHKTYWQDKNILYSGVPYIIVSQKVLDCRHGKDHNKKAKQKYHATKDNKTRKDHVHRKTYNIVQATKKVDCPAKVIVKEIIFFPHFKIQANTPQKRRYSAKLLQESLKSKAMNEFERRFVCIFPDIKDHKAHPVVGQEAGTSPQSIDKLLDPADAPPGCSYAPDPEGHTENLTQPAPPPPKRFSSHATHIRELLNQCKELSYLIEHREHLCIEVLDALKVVKEAMSEGIEKETGVALEKMTRPSKEGPSI